MYYRQYDFNINQQYSYMYTQIRITRNADDTFHFIEIYKLFITLLNIIHSEFVNHRSMPTEFLLKIIYLYMVVMVLLLLLAVFTWMAIRYSISLTITNNIQIWQIVRYEGSSSLTNMKTSVARNLYFICSCIAWQALSRASCTRTVHICTK